MRLFLVRHGETLANARRVIQGHTHNVSLSSRGRGQIEKLAQRLKAQPISAVYSSDLRRACESAEIVAKELSLPVYFDRRLRERCYGEFEGKPVYPQGTFFC